jgi:hypothetical protein
MCAAAAMVAAPAAADAPAGFIGVYSEDLAAADAGATAATQHEAGVRTIRLPFMWSAIEVAPGVYDFSHYDAVVRAAAAVGMTVLPTLLDAPSFRSARPPGTTRIFPPTVPADLGVFGAVLVHRYGEGGTFWQQHPELAPAPIRAWQVWNEPNLPFFWPDGPDPAGYAALLKAAAAGIRAADPGAEIVAAGLPDSDVGMPFEEYMRRDGAPPSTASRCTPTAAARPGRSSSSATCGTSSTPTATPRSRSGSPSSDGQRTAR